MLRVRAAWLGVVGFVFSIRLLRVSYMFSIEQALLSSWKRWDTVRDVLGLRPHLPPRFGCRENPMMPLATLLTGGGGGSGRGDLGSRSSRSPQSLFCPFYLSPGAVSYSLLFPAPHLSCSGPSRLILLNTIVKTQIQSHTFLAPLELNRSSSAWLLGSCTTRL